MEVEIAIALVVGFSFLLFRAVNLYRKPSPARSVAPIEAKSKHESAEKRTDSTHATLNDDSECSSMLDTSSVNKSITSRRFSMRFNEEIESIVVTHRRSPIELVELIEELCLKNYEAGSALYFKGKALDVLTGHEVSVDMFRSLCMACVRVGTPHFVFKYLSEMDEFGIPRDLDFYNSLIKILVFRKYHKICLSLHDVHMSVLLSFDREDSKTRPEDMEMLRTIYSCLLYSSISAKDYWRSPKFFKQLLKTGMPPSDKDWANITKAIVAREDWVNGFRLLASGGSLIPEVTLNQLLDAIIGKSDRSSAMDQLELIIKAVPNMATLNHVVVSLQERRILVNYLKVVMEVVLNGSLPGQADVRFTQWVCTSLKNPDLHDIVAASVMSILDKQNLALSSFASDNWLRVLNEVVSADSGLYTKKLVDHFKQHLCNSQGYVGPLILPDLNTYAILFRSLGSLNEIMDIYRIYENQFEAGLIVPDELFFGNIIKAIAGCTPIGQTLTNWTVALGILNDMTNHMQASTEIFKLLFSVLLQTIERRAVDNTSAMAEAYQFLTYTMPNEHGVPPPMGLFVQVLKLTITSGDLISTNKFFEAMAVAAVAAESDDQDEVSPVPLRKQLSTFSEASELSQSPICSEQLLCLSPRTVTLLLKTAAEDAPNPMDMFLLVLELCLFFKLRLTDTIFNDVAAMDALHPVQSAILDTTTRYKYRVSSNTYLRRPKKLKRQHTI